MTKKEIAAKYIPCTCGEIYKSRNMAAPNCSFCNEDWDEPMEEYAKDVAIDFFNDAFSELEINGVKVSSYFTPDTEEIFKIYQQSKTQP